MNFDEAAVNTFKSIAALAAEYEFRLRLLASRMELPWTSEDKLHAVEKEIIEHFKDNLTEQEKNCLNDVRRLRNKFLHGAFDAVIQIMQEKGILLDTNVRGFDISSERPTSVTQGMFFNFVKFLFGGQVEALMKEFREANNIVTRLNVSF